MVQSREEKRIQEHSERQNIVEIEQNRAEQNRVEKRTLEHSERQNIVECNPIEQSRMERRRDY